MGNKNYLKFIIPIVAVLVVAESIILVGNLGKRTEEVMPTEPQITSFEPTRAPAPLFLSVKSDKEKIKVGEKALGRVELMPRLAKSVDGISVYLKFDPDLVKVSNVEFNADLPQPIVGKVSKSGDMVVVNYLISAKDGYALSKDVPLSLFTFDYEPVMAGEVGFNLLTSKDSKESATMIVENGTSSNLSFEVEDLKIKVER